MNTKVDKVYFLIEDDKFPVPLIPQIECINITNQKWFGSKCPNIIEDWGGIMILIRAAYSKIFPDLDKILSLDIDTMVVDDISELWELDLSNYYLAGVRDIKYLCKGSFYMNGGVVMHNLKKIREDYFDEIAISLLNTQRWRYPEQDVFNKIGQGHILELPSMYNNAPCFENYSPEHPKIIHYVGQKEYLDYPLVQAYENIDWEDIKQ